MPFADPAYWSDLLLHTLQCYDEPLLRAVIAKLVRPRNQWPVDELLERAGATIANTAVVDRRLRELDAPARQALALIGHSRQPRWRLGNLIESIMALGHAEGLKPIFALLEAGLLYPDLMGGREASADASAARPSLKSFEHWLGQANGMLTVFTPPFIAERALGENLGLPECSAVEPAASTVHEADGLEWLLRLSTLWQQTAAAPLRRTLQGGFFKRDLERLQQDPLLSSPPAECLRAPLDPALLTVALAEVERILQTAEGEWRAGSLPSSWEEGLGRALESLYAGLFLLEDWNAQAGGRFGAEAGGNPFPSAYLLALLLLGRMPADKWCRPADIEEWLQTHHPFWMSENTRPSRYQPWVENFLLGLAYPLRLIQATKDPNGGWLVRLSALGRWLLGFASAPVMDASYPQTLLVQPNLEIIAYRQGLTPPLIRRLAQLAAWKNIGAACTLQLGPETVYRALESGLTFETILQTLEQHGTRATPIPVVESLRTWANKRDRITVYPSAAILEFGSAEELNEALARGLPAVRITDRLALVAQEEAIDYRHFRLTGTRDYSLPPDQCVAVEPDGVTLTIDLSRSDLLLETELPRFAIPLECGKPGGRRQYQLTPASVAAGREVGLTLQTLEIWCQQRTGEPLSPAARLLLTSRQSPTPRLQRHLILHVATSELADGLLQWPETRSVIEERLGPTALVVLEENAEALQNKLRSLGFDGSTKPVDHPLSGVDIS